MMMVIPNKADRVGERERCSREPVAGGSEPEGPEHK